MEQETRWKCGLLILGILLLILLLALGRRGIKPGTIQSGNEAEQEKTGIEEQGEEDAPSRDDTKGEISAEASEEEVPVPVYNGRIRVLLKTKGYEGCDHQEVAISRGEERWFFEDKDGILSLNGAPLAEEAFPVCLEAQEGTPYILTSLERACGNPALEGNLEIHRGASGFVIVNDLWLEDYLKYVVPSEMPASYEPEALKAQAVCARTYAYSQMQTYAYPNYLAHVDDSVSFQVYGNLAPAERTSQAVEETAGQILTRGGQAITAYYFSTSWGHTTNQEIWWEGNAKATPYLTGKHISPEGETLDLTSEEAFLAFLENPGEACYDREISWFRWKTQIDVKSLSEHLNEKIRERYLANPEAILTQRRGRFVSTPIASVGTIEKIEVLERGEGGVLHRIQVTGSRRTVQILTEYNIRALLSVQGEPIMRQDGSEVTGGSLLPSGYFALTPLYEGEKLTGYRFSGGGYGHGAGMSQNGANQMAKEGKSWEEILYLFYTEVELEAIGENGTV